MNVLILTDTDFCSGKYRHSIVIYWSSFERQLMATNEPFNDAILNLVMMSDTHYDFRPLNNLTIKYLLMKPYGIPVVGNYHKVENFFFTNRRSCSGCCGYHCTSSISKT